VRGRPWSLALSLLATTLGIVLAGLVASFLLLLSRAPERVHAECESAMDLARRLVRSAEASTFGVPAADRLLATVAALREIRHLEVEMQGVAAVGQSAQAGVGPGWRPPELPNGAAAARERAEEVPGWLLRWMGRAVADIPPLRVGHHPLIGTVIVHPRPYDEAREFWDELQTAIAYHLTLFLLVSVLLCFVVQRGLAPLRELQAAFERLGRGDYTRPVREDVPGELRAIHAAFNHTAGLLECAQRERESLSRQLLRLQEEERAAIARELHDELAPYLFCIRLDASSNLALEDDTPMAEVREAFAAIDANVAQIQARIRDLLQRLRPVDIDVHGWPEALVTLLDGFRARFPQIDFGLDAEGLDAIDDDTLRVSIYRVVQECLTNAVRHAGAGRVRVLLCCRSEGPDGAGLAITVEDDGRGPPAPTAWGRGLTGMRERLQALGGALEVEGASPRGTRVSGRVPLPR
jgi:two-component system sensor histidine kinase UhpB